MAARHQTRYDILATNLLFVGLVLSAISSYYLRKELNKIPTTVLNGLVLQLIIGLSSLLVLAHYYFIRKGYRWAKILYFVLTAGNALFVVLDFKGVTAKLVSPMQVAGFIVGWVIQVAALVLLVRSYRSTQWSREPEVAPVMPEG